MKERPILFSSAMVRALLAGTKTQTRRAMSVQPSEDTTVHVERFHQTVIDRRGDEQPGPEVFGAWWHDGDSGLRCPYGAPGDVLYVREAYSGPYSTTGTPPRDWPIGTPICYWADGNPEHGNWTKPKPGMHLPRWASRILLEITEVRVERLQDISEADATAEGSPHSLHLPGGRFARENFEHLWWTINGDGSWEANPWVWAVSFRKLA